MRKVLLQARKLTGHDVLRGVDLTLYEGDFVAILGAPRSGKSTLLRLLSFQEPPASGDLYWQGRLVTGLAPGEVGDTARLLCADEPSPAELPLLEQRNGEGQTILLATADPELAIRCRTIYRLSAGLLRLLFPT